MRQLSVFALAVLALGFGALMTAGCGGDGQIPIHRVETGPFEHRVTAEGVLQAVRTTKLTVPPGVQTRVRLAWLAPERSSVEAGDVVARFDPKPIQEKLEDGLADHRVAALQMDKARLDSEAELSRLAKDLETSGLELEHAERFQKTDDQVFSRRDIAEDAIDGELARERRSHAMASTETRRSIARTEQEILEIRQRQAQLSIDQAESGLRAIEIEAPHGGILTLSRDWGGQPLDVGAEMWSGQGIAEIPDLSEMEAEVFVLEADAGGLGEGRRAEVLVESKPGQVFPAKIRRVEAVAKRRFPGSPVQYFGVVLAFDETVAGGLKPGQRVRASLVLGERESAVAVPRQGIFQDGGGARVYVRSGGGFEARDVELGPANAGTVVVEQGLEAGEEIALVRPPNGGGTGHAGGGSAPSDEPEAAEVSADPGGAP